MWQKRRTHYFIFKYSFPGFLMISDQSFKSHSHWSMQEYSSYHTTRTVNFVSNLVLSTLTLSLKLLTKMWNFNLPRIFFLGRNFIEFSTNLIQTWLFSWYIQQTPATLQTNTLKKQHLSFASKRYALETVHDFSIKLGIKPLTKGHSFYARWIMHCTNLSFLWVRAPAKEIFFSNPGQSSFF